MNERSELVSNIVRQIAPKYWLVYDTSDTVVGVIVWIENGMYIPYVDGFPVVTFANRDAVVEYVGVLEAATGRHSSTEKMEAVAS